ncbi:hypothetical protein C8J56DRAFT_950102 [Mycena floridula]|nr:hypothetical protein C8J56DRAFT_950102 [Mycena floridula]
MGSAKRSAGKSQHNARTRTTRSSKSRLLTTDPNQTAVQLTGQLSSLGLYASPTLGDGNCLFRALSDQYYGSPSRHAQVRKDVCDWIEQHQERYEGFVDEDEFGTGAGKGRGPSKVELYLDRMRENATYGGHMELSAFAHLTRRNIKVIQPGLVYVIQWNPWHSKLVSRKSDVDDSMDQDDDDDDELDSLNQRERRGRTRERHRSNLDDPDNVGDDDDVASIYVAYHDWEHFSSIRNLKGPHMGLPCIQESPAQSTSAADSKKIPRVKLKLSSVPESSKPSSSSKPVSKASSKSSTKPSAQATPSPSDPSEIPLPPSSYASPAPSRPLSPSRPSAIPPSMAAGSLAPPRIQRSPKRNFDESSASDGSSESAKRRRTKSVQPDEDEPTMSMDIHPASDVESELSEIEDSSDGSVSEPEDEPDPSPPSLSPPSSSSTSSSSLSSFSSLLGGDSPLSSPTPSPEPEPQVRPLTRRERKKLGLPKPRLALSNSGKSAGKIVIPGGRYLRNRPHSSSVVPEDAEEDEEWKNNGTGRVDVRGFRELKI